METEITAQTGSEAIKPQPATSRIGDSLAPVRSAGFQLPEFLLPREHGAWGMVALPFIAAAIVGGGWLSMATLAAALATLSIFMLRTPLAALWRIEFNKQRQPNTVNARGGSSPAASPQS